MKSLNSAQLSIFVLFALASMLAVSPAQLNPSDHSSQSSASLARRCVPVAAQNLVCTGDQVLDSFDNIGEVKEIVGERRVRVVFRASYTEIIDYAALSPAVGRSRCYDNSHRDAICALDRVGERDQAHHGRVIELFNNRKATVEWLGVVRALVDVEDLVIQRKGALL